VRLSDRRERRIVRLHDRRGRAKEGRFLVEGVRVCGEALDAGVEVDFAVVSDRLDDRPGGTLLRERLERSPRDRVTVDDGALAELADVETHQGVLLVCVTPTRGLDAGWPTDVDAREVGPCRILVLDAVQDPGNVGTLVRAASAFDLDGVVALDGTVDPWSPKVVRAAAGALFHRPVVQASFEAWEASRGERGLPTLVADPAGLPVDDARVARIVGDRRWALLVGNEGRGARPEAVRSAAASVAISIPGPAESLNVAVAGSILLHLFTDHPSERA